MTGVAPVTRAAGSAGRTQTEATQGSEPIGCEPRGRLHRAKRGASGLSRWPLRRPSRNEKVAGGPYQVVHWTTVVRLVAVGSQCRPLKRARRRVVCHCLTWPQAARGSLPSAATLNPTVPVLLGASCRCPTGGSLKTLRVT